MGVDKYLSLKGEEIERTFTSIDKDITAYIHALKNKSSEEVLKGSLEKAQDLINKIIPLERSFSDLQKSMGSFKNHFDKFSNESEYSFKKPALLKTMETKQPEKEKGIPATHLRMPILKGLIYLGGNAKAKEIEEYIVNYFKLGGSGLGAISDSIRDEIQAEKLNMVKMELIKVDEENATWTIEQKGIDFLSQKEEQVPIKSIKAG